MFICVWCFPSADSTTLLTGQVTNSYTPILTYHILHTHILTYSHTTSDFSENTPSLRLSKDIHFMWTCNEECSVSVKQVFTQILSERPKSATLITKLESIQINCDTNKEIEVNTSCIIEMSRVGSYRCYSLLVCTRLQAHPTMSCFHLAYTVENKAL